MPTEKVKRVRAGPGAVKGGCGGLDGWAEGRKMDRRWLTLGDVDKKVYMQRMVVETVLIEVKTAIEPSQGGRASTW